MHTEHVGADVPIYAWDDGVRICDATFRQARNISTLPFIHHHVALMPDSHPGTGSTVGSVIPTVGAVIPAAVGVDIGCGMMAVRLDGATAADLPDSLTGIRDRIERAIPTGRKGHGRPTGKFFPERRVQDLLRLLRERHPKVVARRRSASLEEVIWSRHGTLGGGNHFIEICIDENRDLWVMLHSGSRDAGNELGRYFIELAKADMRVHSVNLVDRDLAYLTEGTQHFADYMFAVGWAQDYAASNREEMMRRILVVLREFLPPFRHRTEAVNCHHNYVATETHFGTSVHVTRKGAVRARQGDMGIVPGSMGARSYIVRGKGNADSFHSCSHGAGRVLSRSEARALITIEDHARATEGIECRKDDGVLDESPDAYKDIDAVMAAQADLVEIVHTLRQVLCIKG